MSQLQDKQVQLLNLEAKILAVIWLQVISLIPEIINKVTNDQARSITVVLCRRVRSCNAHLIGVALTGFKNDIVSGKLTGWWWRPFAKIGEVRYLNYKVTRLNEVRNFRILCELHVLRVGDGLVNNIALICLYSRNAICPWQRFQNLDWFGDLRYYFKLLIKLGKIVLEAKLIFSKYTRIDERFGDRIIFRYRILQEYFGIFIITGLEALAVAFRRLSEARLHISNMRQEKQNSKVRDPNQVNNSIKPLRSGTTNRQ